MTKPKRKAKPKADLDERTAIPLDPEEAIRALLKVDPESEPVVEEPEDEKSPATKRRRGRNPNGRR